MIRDRHRTVPSNALSSLLSSLANSIEGEIALDETSRRIYATDASVYRELPLGVVFPKGSDDIKKIVGFAHRHGIPLVPRAAGTSLAGQVVGNGLVVDVSRYMNRIVSLDTQARTVIVQPGLITDELNLMLRPYGLFFGPETSSSSRCTIGGMTANNSCGAHSIIYGSTRDHVISVKAVLSDGTEAFFGPEDRELFHKNCEDCGLKGEIYRNIRDICSNEANREQISAEFPDAGLHRRNTGYALDIISESAPFQSGGAVFNFSKLLCGSEGTLAFFTEITLNLVEIPPAVTGLLCIHFHSLAEALQTNLLILQHQPWSVELLDGMIVERTRNNNSQRENRFFIEGSPAAILLAEFCADQRESVETAAAQLVHELKEKGLGYHYPLLFGRDVLKVWALRKAGLGMLTDVAGDLKPVSVTEDTAVLPEKLPAYIGEFQALLEKYGLECAYYAHIATGELHMKPVMNLKDADHVALFRKLARETALLVKKYGGSLSGEHGDGRLRGEFIPLLVGEHNYQLMCSLKKAWDPNGIMNPGKIIDAPPMNSQLRYEGGKSPEMPALWFDYSDSLGFSGAIEKCNGSADCRKTHLSGGTMCPSYMADGDEKHSTRARANLIRELMNTGGEKNPFDYRQIYDILDGCLSCKGCRKECPSGIDMAKYKAEFLQQWHSLHGADYRSRMLSSVSRMYRLASHFPSLFNFIISHSFTSALIYAMAGFDRRRKLPSLSPVTLYKWCRRNVVTLNAQITAPNGSLYLLVDEFTNYLDAEAGISAVLLLNKLGYVVHITGTADSGRASFSKGMLKKAKAQAVKNIGCYAEIIGEDMPLVGLEPSAILGFRDEYPSIAGPALKFKAEKLAPHCLMFDEFICREIGKNKISPDRFTREKQHILLHGHCHQKALASVKTCITMLSLPVNYTVEEIPSGCCGMAGSFGYEKEHYDSSVSIAELVLAPAVRAAKEDILVSAPGTSCRQQILHTTGRRALHPAEILYAALRD